jgi:RNA polymerase sigma-70 factor (ECF subfamily)
MMSRCARETGEGSWRPTGPPGFRVVLGQPEQYGGKASAAVSQDETLRSGLAKDLDATFESLVRSYQDRLFSFALRVTGNREDAEEVAQDAFVRAYRALCGYPADRIRALALRAWLYRITLNLARNRLRGKRHRTISLDHAAAGDGPAAFEPADDPEGRPDALYETSRRRLDIQDLVATLPERYRAPLVLRYVEGLQLDEVSRVLGQPVGTTKSNVHRGINALREALSDSRRAAR